MGLSIDREKIIKDLEFCVNGHFKVELSLATKILALLKEQEPKQIVRKQGKHENSDGSIDYFADWYCPHCEKLLRRGFDTPWMKFCYMCGQELKWK